MRGSDHSRSFFQRLDLRPGEGAKKVLLPDTGSRQRCDRLLLDY